jgi:hypothetical protein
MHQLLLRSPDEPDQELIDQAAELKEKYCKEYWAARKIAYNAHPNNDQIAACREIIKSNVETCHLISRTFQTAYSTILYPKFAAGKDMVKKKATGELPGEWKSTLQYMAHARHRVKLVRKVGVMGKCIVGPSEACSTMLCPFCRTLATPGMHWVHHCPNCKKTALRDDCGRGIGLLTDTRILIKYREGRRRWVTGQQLQGAYFVSHYSLGESNGTIPTPARSGLD